MELGVLKPLLTSLAMPPLAPLLLALLGMLLAWRRKRGGLVLVALSLAALWLLSCHGTAVWLARHALPQFDAVTTAQLKANQVQAVVILGGGVLPDAPEYGGASQPSPVTAARLRYGIWLARQSGLPLAFSGGIGWAADGMPTASEAEVAARVAQQAFGFALRWSEAVSRDTDGNARLLAPVLMREGVQRIALVTDAWHMPRSVAAFERAGFVVTPAPMGFTRPIESTLLEWLPSAQGLLASRQVLRECLGRAVGRFTLM
ncbi:Probable transmembrane protein [Polaromonas sp. CG9_12]|nr:Probable transmembrane protein [Polaromonas sp. CG9_12]